MQWLGASPWKSSGANSSQKNETGSVSWWKRAASILVNFHFPARVLSWCFYPTFQPLWRACFLRGRVPSSPDAGWSWYFYWIEPHCICILISRLNHWDSWNEVISPKTQSWGRVSSNTNLVTPSSWNLPFCILPNRKLHGAFLTPK